MPADREQVTKRRITAEDRRKSRIHMARQRNPEVVSLLEKGHYFSDVAERSGMSRSQVHRIAKLLDIKPPPRGVRRVVAEYAEMLGKHPDNEVAEVAGVSVTSVFLARKQLGVKAYSRYSPGDEESTHAET